MAEDVSDARISPGEGATRKRRVSRVRVWSLLSELARVILRGDDVPDDEAAPYAPVSLEPDPPIVRWQPRPRAREAQSMSSVWHDVQTRALKARLLQGARSTALMQSSSIETEVPIPTARPASGAVQAQAPAPVRPAPMTAAARTSSAVDAAIDWGPVMLARISDDFARRPATAD